ncbi:fibronectin type III domain-containing protein, partial [Mesonia oceanica]
TENSASVSWTENGEASSWEVIYGESGFDPATEGESVFVANNPELNLTNLSPNTAYDFYVEALCSEGQTELSESENFTTLELPCNPPSNLSVTNITENSASVSWMENGNATSWEVIYGESGFDPATEGESILVENDPQINLTNLSPNTTYEFYIEALCSEGQTELSESENFTTLELPCNPPSNLNVTNITENSASVSWMENGNATSWEVIYGESGFDPAIEGESILVANNPELNLTDLSPNTTYEFYIEALCSDNETELSEAVSFTTLELPCNPPSNLNVTNITENSANVSWTENGNATSWEVTYGESGFDPATEGESILVADNPELNLTDLSPNTTYEFYIEALCSDNETELSEAASFTTLEFSCNPPSDLSVTSITENSASVSWMENGNATSWEVIYGESGFNPLTEGESILVANNPELNLTDLSPDTAYEFYVKALCLDNETELSISQNFITEGLSVNESNFSSFNYYPNPTSSVINLEAGHRISQIEIYSVTGKRLMFFQPHSLSKEINLESMAAGIYLMKITIENQIKTFKIIKE